MTQCFVHSNYSLNPDRGTIYGWNISYDASDTWWWQKVDCETGEKADDNRVGACPGFPLDKVPSNPTSACFVYNGTCYKCNPDRGSDCSQEWLWKYSFNYSNWWYTQVDCNDPYEEEVEGEFFAEGCLDESLLRKMSMQEYVTNDEVETLNYSVDFTKVSQKYDALGRRNMYRPSEKIVLFNKNIRYDKKELNEERFIISGTLSGSSAELCDWLPSGEWVCGKNRVLAKRLNDASEFNNPSKCNIKLGANYGIVENGYLVGGMTCAWPNKNVDESKSGYITRISDIAETTEFVNGKKRNVQIYKYKVEYKIVSNTVLGDNDHLTVETGYVFPNGHVTTSDEERAFDKHENGHEKYNSCVIFDEIEKSGEFECAIKFSKSMRDSEKNQKANEKVQKEVEKVRDDLIEKQLKKDQVKLNNAAVKFHKDYGIGGWSDSYECPKY